jgi:hypothetical protein
VGATTNRIGSAGFAAAVFVAGVFARAVFAD